MKLIIFLSGARAIVCSMGTGSIALAPKVIRGTHLGFLVISFDCGRGPNLLDKVIKLGVGDVNLEFLEVWANSLVQYLLGFLNSFVVALSLPFLGTRAVHQGRLHIVSW
jgi:hypothetical protein